MNLLSPVAPSCCGPSPTAARPAHTRPPSLASGAAGVSDVRPEIGVCDFCGEGEREVIDAGVVGYLICGFSVCEACCKVVGYPWGNPRLDRQEEAR